MGKKSTKSKTWNPALDTQKSKFLEAALQSKEEIHDLAYIDNPGILMEIYGRPGVGKSILLATLSLTAEEGERTLMIDITKQGRSLAAYKEYFPDLDYIRIWESDPNTGKFSAGITCEKFILVLADSIQKYKNIAIDGYGSLIQYYNTYLRQALGLTPIRDNPKVFDNQIDYSDWNWRNVRYYEMQDYLQAAADGKKNIICATEGTFKKEAVKSENGLEFVETPELQPVHSDKLSDSFMFDIQAELTYDPVEDARYLRIVKSKIPGIRPKTEIRNPTFKKFMMLRKTKGKLNFT